MSNCPWEAPIPLEVSFINHGRRHTWLRWHDVRQYSGISFENHSAAAVIKDYPDARAITVTLHKTHRPDASGVCSLCGAICEAA
jgi:hypothetical protein